MNKAVLDNRLREELEGIEYIEPPATGLLEAGILGDAMNFADTAVNANDALGSIPDFGDSTAPLRQTFDGAKTATTGIDTVVSNLENIFG